ncbi:aKG-HExxH-type peptide beta-hydroxylase [Legionella genomosp. 1]|uniref:aKG-HExxH-type peptide beta-hydroxylase n=1 Tax=Legionella genomosp. 1 TaxID=1093625 RepID=UPI001056AC9B|nr:HEXXH motif-containing putative peptide modification protein [Legionella genomosp. 1]
MMNAYHLPFEQISAVPQRNMSSILHEAYKHRFIHSLIKLINYAQQVLDKDYSALIARLDQLEPESKNYISPWLYAQYFWLLEAMRSDSVLEVNRIIRDIIFNTQWIITKTQVSLGLQEDWEKKIFAEEVNIAFGSDPLNAYTPPQSELFEFQNQVSNALQLIKSADNCFMEEIETFVSAIYLVKSDVQIVGATSPKFFGAIYLSLPDGNSSEFSNLLLIEHLVHETSHLFLNSVLAHDPLILNEEDEHYVSPIRSDLRPMLGIYHTSFVLSRVIRVFKKLKRLDLFNNQSLEVCISNLSDKYQQAFSTANAEGIHTELGKQILLSTQECALA